MIALASKKSDSIPAIQPTEASESGRATEPHFCDEMVTREVEESLYAGARLTHARFNFRIENGITDKDGVGAEVACKLHTYCAVEGAAEPDVNDVSFMLPADLATARAFAQLISRVVERAAAEGLFR